MRKWHALLIVAMFVFSLFASLTSGTPEATGNHTQKHPTGALFVPLEEYEKVTGFKFERLSPQEYLKLIEKAPPYPGRESLKGNLEKLSRPEYFSWDNLPAKIVNGLYLPPIRSQGYVGSCVAWASTYYTWTYMINWFRGNPTPNTEEEMMNPTFTYNLINDGNDSGSFMLDAMNLLSTVGAVPLDSFPLFVYGPYGDPDNYAWLWPNSSQWIEAAYNRGVEGMAAPLGYLYDIYVLDLTNQTQFLYLKGLLAYGYIAYTGINVYDEFQKFDSTNNVYALNQDLGQYEGGHAVTIVGYDDTKQTPDGQGAFLLVNSWGKDWGDKGYFWLTYQAAQDPNHEIAHGYTYVLVPKYSGPKVFAGFKINHPRRGEIIGQGGIEIGLGDPSSPKWSRRYFNFYMGYYQDLTNYQAHPFPNSPIYLDISDALDHVTGDAVQAANSSVVVPVYIRVKDKLPGGTTGTLESFGAKVTDLDVESWSYLNRQIPEDRDLIVFVDVPVAVYSNLSEGTLNRSWLYVEAKTVLDVEYADLVLTNMGEDKGTAWYQLGQPQSIEGTDWVLDVLDISVTEQKALVDVKNAITGQEALTILKKDNPVDVFSDGSIILTLKNITNVNNNTIAEIHTILNRWTGTYYMNYDYNWDSYVANITYLEPGNYTYYVSLHMWDDEEIRMPAKNVTLLGEPVATLKVLSGPSGADVYIDGNYSGTTPLILSIPSGNHAITIEKQGYKTYNATFNVKPQEYKVINVLLRPVKKYALYPVGDYPTSLRHAGKLFFVFNNLGTPDAFSTALYTSPTVGAGNNVRRISKLASKFNTSEVSPEDVIVSVGGPLVNPITARYDNISKVHMVVEGRDINVVTPNGTFTWTAPKPWWNVTQGYFVIQAFADSSINATVFTIYGTDADSTAAGAYYFLTEVYPNIENYRDVYYLVGQWRDSEPGADVPLPGADQGDKSGFSAGDGITIVAKG